MGTQNLNEFKALYFKTNESTESTESTDSPDSTDMLIEPTENIEITESIVDKYIQTRLCHTDETKYLELDGVILLSHEEKPLFLSTDDIFHDYRKWLKKNYIDKYTETQFQECFGGTSPDRTEIITKLMKVYGELTHDPHSFNHRSIDAILTKNGYGFNHIKFV